MEEIISQVAHNPDISLHSMVKEGLYDSIEQIEELIPPIEPDDGGPYVARTRFAALYTMNRDGQRFV